MINYIEKGAGLHAAIRKAGHTLHEENGQWVASDEAAVQAIIDSYGVAPAQDVKLAEISLKAKLLRDKVVSSISAGEMASWPIKLAEAAKYKVSADPADAPMLSAEAAGRGVTLDALVARVDGNAAGFAGLEAVIAGVEGRHRDAVKALTDFIEIAGYDYSQGWPEV